MTCIKPDYSEEEIRRALGLERLIETPTDKLMLVSLEGLGPACIPIKPLEPKVELPEHSSPCPIYTNSSAALYRTPREEIVE